MRKAATINSKHEFRLNLFAFKFYRGSLVISH
jgi:hypothetical protein